MNRLFSSLALCLLLLCPTLAFAGEADRMHGTWVIDLESTIELLKLDGGMPSEELDEIRAVLSSVKVTYDMKAMTFVAQMADSEAEVMTIEQVTENADGSIHLVGEKQDDTYLFRPDGTLLVVQAGVILKKVQ